MSGIQLLLTAGIVIIFFYYIAKVRSAFFDIIIIAAFSCAAIFFILFPENTNLIAHWVGVGRGADLLFYCCILLFLFLLLKLFARIRRLEKTITDLVREQSKANAIELKDTDTQ